MGAWRARLAERGAHGTTAKTAETRSGARVSSVLAVTARAPEGALPDPFVRWRLANAERLTAGDLARGYDAGGYCGEHGRVLSHPEQRREDWRAGQVVVAGLVGHGSGRP